MNYKGLSVKEQRNAISGAQLQEIANRSALEFEELNLKKNIVHALIRDLIKRRNDEDVSDTQYGQNASCMYEKLSQIGKALGEVCSRDYRSTADSLICLLPNSYKDIFFTSSAIKEFTNEFYRNLEKANDIYDPVKNFFAYHINEIISTRELRNNEYFIQKSKEALKDFIVKSIFGKLEDLSDWRRASFVDQIYEQVKSIKNFAMLSDVEMREIFKNVRKEIEKLSDNLGEGENVTSDYENFQKNKVSYLELEDKLENSKTYNLQEKEELERELKFYTGVKEGRRESLEKRSLRKGQDINKCLYRINKNANINSGNYSVSQMLDVLIKEEVINGNLSKDERNRVIKNIIIFSEEKLDCCFYEKAKKEDVALLCQKLSEYGIDGEILSKYDFARSVFSTYGSMTKKMFEICEIVRKAKNKTFLIAAHVNPDCDAYGSMIALGTMIESYGGKVIYYNETAGESCHKDALKQLGYKDVYPNPFINKVSVVSTIPNDVNIDGVFVLDGSVARTGEKLAKFLDKNKSLELKLIDHHVNSVNDEAFSDVTSTCEVVAGIYASLSARRNFSIDENDAISRCLYTGWSSDTRGFVIDGALNRNDLKYFLEKMSRVELTSDYLDVRRNDVYETLDADVFRAEVLHTLRFTELGNLIKVRIIPYHIREKYESPNRVAQNNYKASGGFSIFEDKNGELTFSTFLGKTKYKNDRFELKTINLVNTLDPLGGGHVDAGGGKLGEHLFNTKNFQNLKELLIKQLNCFYGRSVNDNTLVSTPKYVNDIQDKELESKIENIERSFKIYKALYDMYEVRESNLSENSMVIEILNIADKLSYNELQSLVQIHDGLKICQDDFIKPISALYVSFVKNCVLDNLCSYDYFEGASYYYYNDDD